MEKATVKNRKPAADESYEEWYEAQIKLGLDDIEAGNVLPHDEVVKRGQAQIAKLKRKYANAVRQAHRER